MKAIALISGGLDSTLAAKLIQNLGIELIALNTLSPFCLCNHRSSKGCIYGADRVAKNLGLKLINLNVTAEFLEIVRNPRHGYGSNMNPCIDCRILLFTKAKETMQKEGASFVITGEVLGQRPMSQHRQALNIIEKEGGLEGLVLRPLSARLLPETLPEKKGWVDRNKLLNFCGRTRKPQIELADKFNIKDYPCAAGGCLLTDPQFAKRIKDLLSHEELDLNNIELLKIGRHFRLSENAKLVVGRNEKENERLLNLTKENDYLFRPSEIAGPTALGRGIFSDELINLSCSITCHYCDLNGKFFADIVYKRVTEKENKLMKVSPVEDTKLKNLRI